MKGISISKPKVNKKEIQEMVKVLSSGALIQGKRVEEFEKKFASYIGTKHAVAVSSGTAALHLVFAALDLKPGDEVITTPFSFIASSNSIVLAGGKPVFVDIDSKTFNIDPREIEKKITKKTIAILPVHLYGYPSNMSAILKIAKKHKLFVVEDACQAHGAKISSKKVGSFGDAGCFSFYPTKNMFVGEGGMITTNSSSLAKRLKLLRNHGSDKQYVHSIIGYNYRMTDVSAALGILQLKNLDANNRIRKRNASLLSKELRKYTKLVTTPYVEKGYTHVFHQYTIVLNSKKVSRNKMQSFLQKNGITSRIYYPIPIHKQLAYKNILKNQSYKISEELSGKVLSLPVHQGISLHDIKTIVLVIKKFLDTK